MKLQINTVPPYPVIIEQNAIDKAGEVAASSRTAGGKALIVSDSNVFPIYGDRVAASLEKAGFQPFSFVFPAGEESKQISTVCQIYESLSQYGFTRSDFIVTLGGGVAGDMGGFAAATFLRGIPFMQVPTSLLAQVDASVGGKTAVDLPFGKNLVGAFHQPFSVLIDPAVLSTLPSHFFRDGMGEVIKYGCIADAALFASLESGKALDDLESVLVRCVACKKEFVEEDTKDTGKRMILNFGHTFGHALEKLHHFQGISHGEAVGIGMVLAAEVGEKKGITPSGTADRIAAVLKQYGLPVQTEFSRQEILDATALDKKTMGKLLHFILLEDIGKSTIQPFTKEQLAEVFLDT